VSRAAAGALVLVACGASGCIGFPFASLGGRGRVAVAAALGDVESRSGRGEVAVQAHVGTAILSVTDPGPRELDVEVGYALDAFPGHQDLDRHGGYAGVHWLLWNAPGARASIGADVDVLWGFDQRLALGGTISGGIEAYAGCTGAMGGGDAGYAGLIGFGRGEWGLGVQAHVAYRFVDGDQQWMLGGSVSFRFPAGVGVGFVTALAAAEAASTTRGAPDPDPDPSLAERRTRQHTEIAPFGFCEQPLRYEPIDAPSRTPRVDRWRCEAVSADRTLREEGFVTARGRAEAEQHCREEFVAARGDGARCACSPAP
jgi:hypothetical protein